MVRSFILQRDYLRRRAPIGDDDGRIAYITISATTPPVTINDPIETKTMAVVAVDAFC